MRPRYYMGRLSAVCPIWLIAVLFCCIILYVFLYGKVESGITNGNIVRSMGLTGGIQSLYFLSRLGLKEPSTTNEHIQDSIIYRKVIDRHQSDTKPILTLFTTWVDEHDKYDIHNNTVGNWLSLMPYVTPVLFTNDSSLRERCLRQGWNVEYIRTVAAYNAPVLKYMFLDAMRNYNSTYYAYSNSDILFTESLVASLWAIRDLNISTNQKIFITGRRINVKDLLKDEVESFVKLRQTAQTRGKLFQENSEDYFITNAIYPWAELPNLVVGRPAYDNWIVLNARRQKQYVIDSTDTILAVHQTTSKGNFEGHTHKDARYNSKLLAKMFKKVNYLGGSTTCTKYRTMGNTTHGVTLVRRLSIPKFCVPVR